MASLNNDINVSVGSSSNTKGIDDTSSALDKMGEHSEGLKAKTVALGVTIGNLAADGLKQAASGLFDMGKSAIESAGQFEQSRISFEVMLGSADKAKALMNQIADFAQSTPFELPEVVAGTKQLLAFGFAQEELIPTMRKLGDIASGVGVPVGQLTNVFGQVRVAGKLMGGDLLQFTNAGVPMIEALAKTMKKSQGDIKDLVSQGKVGFKEVDAAINSLTDTGSKFGGMMDKQSGTFNGVVSNMQDGFGKILRSAVGMDNAGNIVKGSFFDRIKDAAMATLPAISRFADNIGPAMQNLLKWFDQTSESAMKIFKSIADYLGPKFIELGKSINENIIPILKDLWKNVIEPLIPVIGTTLVVAIGAVVDIVSALFKGLGWLYQQFKDGDPVILGLAGVFGTLAAAMAFNSVFSALSAGFSILTTVTIPAVMTSFGGLAALIASPIVMPAIAVGAAIAAIVSVKNAYNDAVSAINQQQAQQQAIHDDNVQQIKNARARYDKGEISHDKMMQLIGIFARASGGPVTPGQAYAVGDNPDGSWNATTELFVPDQPGHIVSAPNARAMLGGGSSGASTTTINVTNNNYSQIDYDRGIAQLGFKLRRA